jgi:hypothetical protein
VELENLPPLDVAVENNLLHGAASYDIKANPNYAMAFERPDWMHDHASSDRIFDSSEEDHSEGVSVS